jgi:hypothetical protein
MPVLCMKKSPPTSTQISTSECIGVLLSSTCHDLIHFVLKKVCVNFTGNGFSQKKNFTEKKTAKASVHGHCQRQKAKSDWSREYGVDRFVYDQEPEAGLQLLDRLLSQSHRHRLPHPTIHSGPTQQYYSSLAVGPIKYTGHAKPGGWVMGGH